MATANELEGKLKGHEDLCEERHENIKRRLDKIEVKLDKLLNRGTTEPVKKPFWTPVMVITITICLLGFTAGLSLIASGQGDEVFEDIIEKVPK